VLDTDEWERTAQEAGLAPDQSGHFGEYKSLASLYLGSNTGPSSL